MRDKDEVEESDKKWEVMCPLHICTDRRGKDWGISGEVITPAQVNKKSRLLWCISLWERVYSRAMPCGSGSVGVVSRYLPEV